MIISVYPSLDLTLWTMVTTAKSAGSSLAGGGGGKSAMVLYIHFSPGGVYKVVAAKDYRVICKIPFPFN